MKKLFTLVLSLLLTAFFAVDTQAQPRAVILNDSPVVYYAFEETSGTVAVDSSGNGNDGTYVGTTLGADGVSGNGVELPVGAGSYVEVPDLGECYDSWTLEMYITSFDAVDPTSGCCTSLFSTDACGDDGCNHMNFLHGEDNATESSGSHGFILAAAGLPEPSALTEPTHIAFVNDLASGTGLIYVNGVLVETEGTVDGCGFFGAARIGSWSVENRYFQGTIDDFAIFDSALSAEIILAHYEELGPPSILVDQTATVDIAESHISIPTSTTFTVALAEDPNLGTVIVTLDPNNNDGDFSELDIDLGLGAAIPITLTFDTTDWDSPQIVTITAVNDSDPEECFITAGINLSSTIDEPNENDLYVDAKAKASVIVLDNETGCVIVDEGDGVTIDELDPNGTIDSVTYVLNRAPSGSDNVITLEEPLGLATVSPLSLTFNSGNWAIPQTVSIKANLDDELVGEDPVVTGSSSGDSDPQAFNPVANVSVDLIEDECGELPFSDNDYNQDCLVNLLDFSLFSASWGNCTQPDPANCP